MEKLNEYKVISVMSGTSLDGLDLAYCRFSKDQRWNFEIVQAKTIPYDCIWKERLRTLEEKTAFEYVNTHVEYGHYIGEQIKIFITEEKLNPDFIASHGHTIFHQPDKKLTAQIGDGAAIASICKLPVVADFRSLDVALGGQGAPLVPIGDALLFSDFDCCLNLGGIANISFREGTFIKAFDVCPANMVLNYLVAERRLDFDEGGRLAASGKVNLTLLNTLNHIEFYSKQAPKSIGKEWVFEKFIPVLTAVSICLEDKLATVSEHIAFQIKNTLPEGNEKTMLITGGGALNKHLIDRIATICDCNCKVPEANTVNYKEALIFAFLGVLRMRNEVNCLKSVTGADRDSIAGAIYLG